MDKPIYTLQISSELDLKMSLLKQRREKQHCDVTLLVGKEKMLAHRCVLAAASEYFSNVFKGDNQETKTDLDLSNSGIEADTLSNVIDFMYGCPFQVTDTNIKSVIASAKLFQLNEFETSSLRFLLTNLTLQNCLQTWIVAMVYNLENVCHIARSFALSRFHDTLIQSEETFKINVDDMFMLFANGLGKFCNNEKIELFISKYIKYDQKNRQKYEKDLMEVAKVNTCKDKQQEFASSVENQVEELLMWQLQKQYVLYNPAKDVYLKVPNLDKLSRDWSVALLGIGENFEYALINIDSYSGTSRKLFNIFTHETLDIPIVPAKGSESVSKSSQRDKEIFGTYNGELVCIFKSNLLLDRRALSVSGKGRPAPITDEEDRRGSADERVTAVFVQRFDSTKRKWKLVGTVYEKAERNVQICCIFRTSPCSFIIVQSPQEIEMFSLDFRTYEIKILAVLNIQQHYQPYHRIALDVLGDSRILLLKINENIIYRYVIEKNMWEKATEIEADLFNEYLVLSKSRGIIYQKESEQNLPLRMFSLNPSRPVEERKELCPPPCLKPDSDGYDRTPSILNVPLPLLERFETVSMIPHIRSRLLDQWRVHELLRRQHEIHVLKNSFGGIHFVEYM